MTEGNESRSPLFHCIHISSRRDGEGLPHRSLRSGPGNRSSAERCVLPGFCGPCRVPPGRTYPDGHREENMINWRV